MDEMERRDGEGRRLQAGGMQMQKYGGTMCACVFMIMSGSALHEAQHRDKTYKVQLSAKLVEKE